MKFISSLFQSCLLHVSRLLEFVAFVSRWQEPTHYSKRVGDVVPGVVVYLHLHHHSSRVGKVQWAHENGLIAAAIGTLSMLTSKPTAKSDVKRTRMFVLSLSRHYITLQFGI